MANETQYSSFSTLIPNIYEAALLTLRETAIVAPWVTPWSNNGLQPHVFGTTTEGTVQTIAGTTDMSAQAFSGTSSGTITPAMYGAQYFINDTARDSDPNIAGLAGRSLGQILGEKMDVDLCTMFASFTGSVGSAAGTLTWANFMLAIAKLRANLAPQPYVAVFHPYQWYYLASAASGVPTLGQAPAWMDEFSRQFFMGQYAGVSIIVDANIPTPGNAGIMMSRQAIALDTRRALRISPQRDESRGGGGYELNATMVYGTGIYRPTFGIKLLGTCA